jgi:hypothetical protein
MPSFPCETIVLFVKLMEAERKTINLRSSSSEKIAEEVKDSLCRPKA